MKNLLKVLLQVTLFINFLNATTDCRSIYNCVSKARPPKNIATNYQCTLPSKSSIPITALDVFDSSGHLKEYFGTGETVCDVLGWLDDGV